jgi:hypothetical protein
LPEEAKESFLHTDEDTIIKEADEVEETVEKASGCPDCGKSHDAPGCDNAYHKSSPEPTVQEVDVDKETARTQVTVTVDSESTQDAPTSNPGSVLMDEDRADTPGESDNDSLGDTVTHDAEPDTIKDVEADVEEVPEDVGNFSMKTADLETIVKQLQAVVTENTDLRKQLVDTESERDELKENFDVAKGIIERIADLPIGRKTQFAGAIEDFRAKYPQYDNEFVKMLEK